MEKETDNGWEQRARKKFEEIIADGPDSPRYNALNHLLHGEKRPRMIDKNQSGELNFCNMWDYLNGIYQLVCEIDDNGHEANISTPRLKMLLMPLLNAMDEFFELEYDTGGRQA